MNDLERIRSWISTYPATDRLRSLTIDYYAPRQEDGIQPAGLEEISRREGRPLAISPRIPWSPCF